RLLGRFHHAADVRIALHVRTHELRFAARAADRGNDLLAEIFLHVGDEDLGTLSREDSRGGFADSGCTAGDDRYLSRKSSRHEASFLGTFYSERTRPRSAFFSAWCALSASILALARLDRRRF